MPGSKMYSLASFNSSNEAIYLPLFQGKHYATGGFKEGDVLGCLISLPLCPSDNEYKFDAVSELPPSTSYLPPSHKDLPLINFKHHYFYEEKDDVQAATKTLQPLAGSSVSFFLFHYIIIRIQSIVFSYNSRRAHIWLTVL